MYVAVCIYKNLNTHTVCTIIYLLFLKKTVQLKVSFNLNSASKMHLSNHYSPTIFLLLFTLACTTTTASIHTYLQRL